MLADVLPAPPPGEMALTLPANMLAKIGRLANPRLVNPRQPALLLTLLVVAGSSACGPRQPTAALDPPLAAPPPPSPSRSRDYWPTTDWRRAAPQATGLDPAKLQELATYAFSRSGDDQNRAGLRSDGLVIIHHGQLVHEQYARGYGEATPHLAWSVSKSFLATLVGIAVADGRLRPEDPAYRYYPGLDSPGKRAITIDHLLHMSSGLAWSEGYETSPLTSSVLAMLYTAGHRDMAAYTAQRPLAFAPGSRWLYSSGDSNLLSAVLAGALPAGSAADFPWQRLFDRLGMRSVVWERDSAGTYIASSYVYASPRDLARLGFLFLNDGLWEGQRILPAGWVDYLRRIAPAFAQQPPKNASSDGIFGAHLWLNQAIPEHRVSRPWPSAPEDAYAMEGHWGQRVFIIPSLDLVAVRTGDDRDDSFVDDQFLKRLLGSVPGGEK